LLGAERWVGPSQQLGLDGRVPHVVSAERVGERSQHRRLAGSGRSGDDDREHARGLSQPSGHAIVTRADAVARSLDSMPAPVPRPPRRRKPRREPWSAALAPSQRRAAEARAAVSRERSTRMWLRSIAPR